LITAYGFFKYRDPDACGCDLERLARIEAKLRRIKEEFYAKQQQAMDSFIKGEIDFNSNWYKEYIRKWEYTIDFGVFEYRTSEFYTMMKVNVWTPVASASTMSMINHMSGTSRTSGDLTLGPSVGVFSLEAKFGYTIEVTRGSDGNVHVSDVDLRAGLEGKVRSGPLLVGAGIDASLAKGTTAYGRMGLVGNKHVDDWKNKSLSEKIEHHLGVIGGIAGPAEVMRHQWKGEYKFE
jgi:hypothetical protein